MKKSIPFALAAAALIVGLVVTEQSDAQVTHPGGGFVPPGKLGGSGAGGGGSGTITGVTAGSGLIGGGSSGTVTVNVGVGSGIAIDADHVAIDQSYTQRRLSGSCLFGQFLTAVGSDGTITCAADTGDITAVNTGGSGGLTGGVTSGAANLSLLTSCSDQQLLKWGSASSAWACASDANTTYGAGTSISLTGTTFALNEPGASCSAGQYLSAMNATGTGTCTAEVGDIAGITTASTSGLTGGCTSGTCSVSLLTSCGGNQVLAWNSGTSTWTCTTPTTGTVTSSTLTTNTVPKATGAGALGDSSLTDDGTTFKVASTKFQVTESNGNTSVAGTLGVTGATTLGALLTVNASEVDNAPTSTTGISIVQGHTAQTSTPIGLSYDDTGATAGTAVDSYGVKINEVATCSVSDCTRQNYGLYVSASGALNGNFALETGSGDVILNSVSGATQIRSTLLVSGLLTLSSGLTGLATTTCTTGKVVTAIAADGTATCSPEAPNSYGGKHFEWNDDWLYQVSTTNGGALGPWECLQSGTSSTCSGAAGVAVSTRPGVQVSTTGSTTTGRSALILSEQAVDFGGGNWSFQDVIGVPTISNGTDEFEFIDGFFNVPSSVNQTNGCYFLYDRGNVATSGPNSGNTADLSCWCANGGAVTTFLMNGSVTSDESFATVAAPVAAVTWPSTNVLDLQIKMTTTAGTPTRAEFYVNNVKSCDINHNMPSGSSALTGIGRLVIKSAGTSSRNLQFDYTDWAVDLTSARTP